MSDVNKWKRQVFMEGQSPFIKTGIDAVWSLRQQEEGKANKKRLDQYLNKTLAITCEPIE